MALLEVDMFTCPSCLTETPKLIGSSDLKKVVCPNCYQEKGRVGYNYRLNEIVAQKDGHKVTLGKQKEIDGRYISLDDKTTVLSRDNGGREARY